MQPYFFPYLGYFALINMTDQFILFDTAQYMRHGWVDRNRILKENGDFIYIRPEKIKHSNRIPINEIQLKNDLKWKDKMTAQMSIYKKAPHYREVTNLIEEIFDFEAVYLSEFNKHSLKLVCDYLEIDTTIKLWSKMNRHIENANEPDEWALNICKDLGADSYINPEDGKAFFNPKKYIDSGIDIKFMKFGNIEYKQFNQFFTSRLSIIDVMMFNSVSTIHNFLQNIELNE